MALKSTLIEWLIVKAAKFRSQATKGSDKCKLRCDVVNHSAEANLLYEPETTLRFTLDLYQRISGSDKVRDQVVEAIGRKGKITDFVRGIEGATYQIATGLDMSRPWHDDISEIHVRARLEVLQSVLLDQIVAEPTESRSCVVVAEARSGYDGKPYVSEARAVAVTMLEAEIHHAANDERAQILVATRPRPGHQERRGHPGWPSRASQRVPRSPGFQAGTRFDCIRA